MRSIPITETRFKALDKIARKVGSKNKRGTKAGKPSARALINEIADGRVEVVKNAKDHPPNVE